VKVPGSACRAICAKADSGISAKAATSSAETRPRAGMGVIPLAVDGAEDNRGLGGAFGTRDPS
jgi:hypothetical protein